MTRSIPLELITLERTALRYGHDVEKIRLLAASIDQHGLLQPIVVREGIEDNYLLIAGVRRFKAVSQLGWDEIECTVVTTDHADVVPAFVENIQRLQMSPTEEAAACKHMHTVQNMSIGEIADTTNHGRSWVQQRLMLADWPDYATDPIGKKKLSIGAVALLMEISHEDTRKYYIQIGAANGCTAQQAQAWLYDFQSREQMTHPEGVDGPIPELPPRLPPLRCPCFLCREDQDPAYTLMLRVCASCHQELSAIVNRTPAADGAPTTEENGQTEPQTTVPNEDDLPISRSSRFVSS